MADLRARAALNGRAVNLAQLADEVGAALTASDTDVVIVDEASTVTAARLEEALASHSPSPLWGATPEETTARTLEDRLSTALDQLRAFIAAGKPSTAAAQASAAYDASKLCCRILVGLIRLHLRRLDGTD